MGTYSRGLHFAPFLKGATSALIAGYDFNWGRRRRFWNPLGAPAMDFQALPSMGSCEVGGVRACSNFVHRFAGILKAPFHIYARFGLSLHLP